MRCSLFYRWQVSEIRETRRAADAFHRAAASCEARGDRIGTEYHRFNAASARRHLQSLRRNLKRNLALPGVHPHAI